MNGAGIDFGDDRLLIHGIQRSEGSSSEKRAVTNGGVEDLPQQVKFAEVIERHDWACVRDDPQLELSHPIDFRLPLLLGHVEERDAQGGGVLDEGDARHPR